MIIISSGTTTGFLMGGLAAIPILAYFSWRATYLVAGLVSVIVLLAILRFLPESAEYLLERKTAEKARRSPVTGLLRGGFLAATILLGLYMCAVQTASHFIVQWMPQTLVLAGLSVSGGISGSVLLSAGMVAGMFLYAFIIGDTSLRRIGSAVAILAFLTASIFALVPVQLYYLAPLAFVLGALVGPAVGTGYAMVALVFPASFRATGGALSLGLGRAGTVIGPVMGGLLIDDGMARTAYSVTMASPYLLAAVLLLLVPTLTASARRAERGAPRE
jgi:AAHS family 4-hydroxybenzoate transporter-like MFS transporter